jgi:putative transcriptional regulator
MPTVKVTKADADDYIETMDWSKIDAMTDEDIARQVAENPDAAPLLTEGADLSKRRRVRGRPRADADETESREPQSQGVFSDVASLRRRLHMTQAEFARAYRFSVGAVRDMEQGRSKPTGPAAALLELIAADPDDVRRKLGKTG